MKQLSVISGEHSRTVDISRDLPSTFAVRVFAPDEFAQEAPNALVFVDIDLNSPAYADNLRHWLRCRPGDGVAIFAVDKGSTLQIVRAYSIGATDVVLRPVTSRTLLGKLVRNGSSTCRTPATPKVKNNGIVAGISALQSIFLSASAGTPLKPQVIADAGQTLVEHIEEYGFADWVRAVRVHHDQTYQHCLLVSGAAAAFGQHLKFNGSDRRRVAMAGLLHDIGKAKIPVAILEKPNKLDDEETATLMQHAVWGHEALQTVKGLHPEMLDVVLHHHEYVDGSGYPHGLQGGEIADLTRVVTIADIFGALIEHRAYKPPMSGHNAFQVLLDMGTKLDRDLVGAFQPLSRAQFE
jgi:putative nucleotidyltransferase with HDIG domain